MHTALLATVVVVNKQDAPSLFYPRIFLVTAASCAPRPPHALPPHR
jgi:hypothetical protein